MTCVRKVKHMIAEGLVDILLDIGQVQLTTATVILGLRAAGTVMAVVRGAVSVVAGVEHRAEVEGSLAQQRLALGSLDLLYHGQHERTCSKENYCHVLCVSVSSYL